MFDFQPLPATAATLDSSDSLVEDFVFDYPQDYYKSSQLYETSRTAYLEQLVSSISTLYSVVQDFTPKYSKAYNRSTHFEDVESLYDSNAEVLGNWATFSGTFTTPPAYSTYPIWYSLYILDGLF